MPLREPSPPAQAQAPSLEQRIADALSDNAGITSPAIAELYAQARDAIAAAEAAVAEAKRQAIDTARPPAFAAHEAVAAAELRRDWLLAAQPKLAAHHRKIAARERYAAWLPKHERAKANRDLLAARLRAVYEPFVEQMVPLLQEIAALDAELDRVNAGKPVDGGVRSLRSVELEARNVDGFGMNGISLVRDLKLPAFNAPGRLLWPPPAPLIDVRQIVPPALLTHHWAAHQQEAKAQAEAEAKRGQGLLRQPTTGTRGA